MKRTAAMILTALLTFSVSCPDEKKPEVDGLEIPPANIPAGPSGTFLKVGDMNACRKDHVAVRMITGDVLVAGGVGDGGTALSSAEIYRYTQGVFLAAPHAMTAARAGFTATTLADNKILFCGGRGASSSALQSAETFDPSTYVFAATAGAPVSARSGHAALLLPNSYVLISGGCDASGTTLATCEIYDPGTGSFTRTDADMLTARSGHTMTLLRNGKALIAGGVDSSGNATTAAEIFDYNPGTGQQGTFAATGSLPAGRASHRACIVNLGPYDGQVVLFGGFSGAALSPVIFSGACVFDPLAGAGTGGFANCSDSMVTARLGHTATILASGSGILLVGGNQLNLPEIFDPDFGTTGLGAAQDGDFRRTSDQASAPTSMVAVTAGRTGHAAEFLLNGTILITGGEDSGSVSDKAEIYNP